MVGSLSNLVAKFDFRNGETAQSCHWLVIWVGAVLPVEAAGRCGCKVK